MASSDFTAPPPSAAPRAITEAMRSRYELTYLVLTGIFVSALVTCNLIVQKFFALGLPLPFAKEPLVFVQSVGILPYPLTFLVTDLLSEVFGRRRANRAVIVGLWAAVFAAFTVQIAILAPAAGFSPISDELFSKVFGVTWAAILASMLAYLAAQFVDIRLFHFWRRLTDGRHLWLRNNASTLASQVLDTALVIAILTALSPPGGGLTWEGAPAIIANGILFKWLIAALDTPFFYAGVMICRRHFGPLMDEAHAMDAADEALRRARKAARVSGSR